jgi:ATP/ADP translocase
MIATVSRFFRVRPGEIGVVSLLGLLLFVNSFALEVADVVAVSGFLSQVAVPAILIVWIVDMTLIMVTAGLQSLIVDRYSRTSLIRWLALIISIAYSLLRLLFIIGAPGWLSYSILFILSDQQWLFFPLIFWVLANDTFDVAQGKRLIPLLAAIGFAGQIVGLIVAASAPAVMKDWDISNVELLTLNAIVYLAIYLVMVVGLRRLKFRKTTQQPETTREILTEGWEFVKSVSSFRYLVIAIISVAMILTAIEFHFLTASDDAFTDPDEFQVFYSLYRLVLTVLSIVIAGSLTSRIIESINLKNAFLIMPVIALAMIIAMLAIPGLLVITIAFIVSRLFYGTIDETSRKSFQALVPEERRGRVSIFMDSYIIAIGTIIGAIVVGIVVFIGERNNIENYDLIYITLAGVAAGIAIWAIYKMRGEYDSSLLNWRMKRRQRRSSVLDKLEF